MRGAILRGGLESQNVVIFRPMLLSGQGLLVIQAKRSRLDEGLYRLNNLEVGPGDGKYLRIRLMSCLDCV